MLLMLLAVSLLMTYCEKRQQAHQEKPEALAYVPLSQPAVDNGETFQAAAVSETQTPALSTLASPPDAATVEFIHQLLNDSLPLKIRRQTARSLAKLGSDQALVALKAALREGTPYLRAAIGEGLGECLHSEARGLLADLANNAEETAARGAIRGMALRADAEAVELLGNMLFDPYKPDSVRTEAALALGDIHQPAALTLLTRAANEIQDETINEHAIEGLGRRPFDETADFFHSYLESSAASAESKSEALEALSQAEGDVGPVLLKYASDPNPEIRAAAAWSLSAMETQTDFGLQLLALLQQETSPEVRLRLYQALANQESCDWPSVLTLAKSESEPGPRLAGFSLVAQACSAVSVPEVLDFFSQTALPELKIIALSSPSPEDRLTAAIILRRAGTTQSAAALHELSRQSNDAKVIAAAQAAFQRRAKQ